MGDARRAQQIEQYATGAAAVEAAAAAADEAGGLDLPGADGGWSPRMVIHHLADSETRSAIRLRQLLAEDQPTIQGYDEARYAETLHYDRPVDLSLSLFAAVRAANLELLRLLPDAEFARAGTHTDTGAFSVETWLETYAAHAHDHAAQIRAAL